MNLKDLLKEISVDRKEAEKLGDKIEKKVQRFEDGLRKLNQFRGDCPECKKPMISFGSHDYDWDAKAVSQGYSDCLLDGKDIRHHDKCFFGRYGHID